MSGVTITGNSYSVHLDIVERIDYATSRNIVNYVFDDGTDTQLDEGKTIDQIILTGVDKRIDHVGTSFPLTFPITWQDDVDAEERIRRINFMMDNQEIVSVDGLVDSSLNTEYIISDFSINQNVGEAVIPLYHFVLTLEKKYDTLG